MGIWRLHFQTHPFGSPIAPSRSTPGGATDSLVVRKGGGKISRLPWNMPMFQYVEIQVNSGKCYSLILMTKGCFIKTCVEPCFGFRQWIWWGVVSFASKLGRQVQRFGLDYQEWTFELWKIALQPSKPRRNEKLKRRFWNWNEDWVWLKLFDNQHCMSVK